MGYIGQTTHTLECACGVTESVTIVERGSAYGSSWVSEKPLKNFKVDWKPGQFRGPEISSASCNKCGATPNVSVS